MLAISTLAAGIVQARGSTSFTAIRGAYLDAMFVIDPAFVADPDEYFEWLEERGFGTTLPTAQ